MEIVTTGLGAGSYPEPPPMQEYEAPACDECGWDDHKLIETDGRMLCPGCRARYMFQNASVGDFRAFVDENAESQAAFYLDYCWPEEERAIRAMYAKEMFYTMLTLEKIKKRFRVYVKEKGWMTDFMDFMDERSKHGRVS